MEAGPHSDSAAMRTMAQSLVQGMVWPSFHVTTCFVRFVGVRRPNSTCLPHGAASSAVREHARLPTRAREGYHARARGATPLMFCYNVRPLAGRRPSAPAPYVLGVTRTGRHGTQEGEFQVLIRLSVLVSGAVLMAMEILAFLINATTFGSAWREMTAVIAVFLTAMSVGYWLGGLL